MNNSTSYFEILKLIIVPTIVAFGTIIITRLFDRNKRKKELEQLTIQIKKTENEIDQIKASFQPLVLATLQKIHETLLQDKIDALKKIAGFRARIFSLSNTYYEGYAMLDESYDFYSQIFWSIGELEVVEFQKILSEKGYIFPNNIIDNLSEIFKVLRSIQDDVKLQTSMMNQSMSMDSMSKIDDLNELLETTIGEIRTDLHIDNKYIHDFIEKHKG